MSANGHIVWEHGHSRGYHATLAGSYVELTTSDGSDTVTVAGC